MNELQIFNNPKFGEIRVIEKDSESWFSASDVCRALTIGDTHVALRRLDEDEKGRFSIPTPGGEQEISVINEAGLYSLALGSRKPEARDFKRWVTHEVLPSIRQKGSYSVPAMTPAQLLAAQAQVLVDMERRMDEMQGQTAALEAKVDTAMKAFSRPAQDHWKADMDKAVKELNARMGWSLPKLQGKLYQTLEDTANCNLNMRLTALRKRMKKTGMRYRDARMLNKLDAVAADKQLRAIFEGIVRSYQAQAVPSREEAQR